MRLKEIKSGMEIRCKDDDEKKLILEEAERLGYVWYGTKRKPTERSAHSIGDTIHFYDKGSNSFSVDYKHITHSCQTGDSVIEFSDLVIPEMTAVEVMEWFREYYIDSPVIKEVFGEDYSMSKLLETYTPKEICDHISDWKSDHEKKEPEIETFYNCRIMQILPDGSRKCVHEEDMELAENASYYAVSTAVKDILKCYCAEHDGEYMAVHEVVSRVKAV